MSSLDIVSVSKRFGTLAAVDAISLSVASGSRTAIVGPSGSGKTTLLRLIAGFEAPDSGSIRLDGELLADTNQSVPAHRRRIGVVAQDGALFPHLSIAENIGFGLERGDPGRKERIAELIDMVGLDPGMLPRKPDQLSGGQQQRVALARALARTPRLMLLDEPFSALDTGLRVLTRKAVAEVLGKAGITTILVTHDQEEAMSFADQVAVLREGRLEQAGPPRALYFRPRTPVVAELLGEALILDANIADGWATCALGRIRVDDEAHRGSAQIMLRPEQVSLRPVAAGGTAGDLAISEPVHGEILNADFAGGTSAVTIRLPRVDHAGIANSFTFALHTTDVDQLSAGTTVALSVRGCAHVFGTVA